VVSLPRSLQRPISPHRAAIPNVGWRFG